MSWILLPWYSKKEKCYQKKRKKKIANGVFIFGKFITQSLDEPERQIIYFFLYNCLAVSRAVYAYFETPYHVLPNLYNFESYSWWRVLDTTEFEIEIYLDLEKCSLSVWCVHCVWCVRTILRLIVYHIYANVFLDVHHEWD